MPSIEAFRQRPLALGAARAALERGLRIPDDLAIVGFDDIEEGRYHTPSLTTIAPDKPALARAAVSRLLHSIDGGASGPSSDVRIPHRLITRESS